MKIVLLCAVALLMVVQLPSEGEAVCCHGRGFLWGARCADCSKATPYCSYGKPCNIFGCNCKGGCRTGACQNYYNHAREMPVSETPIAKEYDVPYDSAPNGKETENPSSDDYEVPADVVPSEEAPAEEVPLDEVPVDEVPSDEVPVEEVPSDEVSYSDSETSPMKDYEMASDDVSFLSDSENPASNDYEMPAAEVTSVNYNGGESETSAEDVIAYADENGDGMMDIDEAERFLVKRGLATAGYRAKRSLREFDLNNDNFISAEEIEQYEEY